MYNSEIKETNVTPYVKVYPRQKLIMVRGQSRHEDPSSFYNQFTELTDDCILEFKDELTIDFKITYLNTSSSKWLFHMLKSLQARYAEEIKLIINWYYEEDDELIQEAGEVFQSLLRIPVNLIAT
jgi:hypothetical protein